MWGGFHTLLFVIKVSYKGSIMKLWFLAFSIGNSEQTSTWLLRAFRQNWFRSQGSMILRLEDYDLVPLVWFYCPLIWGGFHTLLFVVKVSYKGSIMKLRFWAFSIGNSEQNQELFGWVFWLFQQATVNKTLPESSSAQLLVYGFRIWRV